MQAEQRHRLTPDLPNRASWLHQSYTTICTLQLHKQRLLAQQTVEASTLAVDHVLILMPVPIVTVPNTLQQYPQPQRVL